MSKRVVRRVASGKGRPVWPVDVRRPFAEAVMSPGSRAMYLDAANEADGQTSLIKALRSERPFFVQVAADVLACDFDGPRAAEEAERVAHELRERGGYAPIVVESGGHGRRHVFCVISDSAGLAIAKSRAKEQGADVRQAIRPPLTPHRLERPVGLIEPLGLDAALERLRPSREIPAAQKGARPPVRGTEELPRLDCDWQPLSDNTEKLLMTGDFSNYDSRSSGIQAILTQMVASGWSAEDGFEELMNFPGGRKIQDMDDARATKWFANSWESAWEFVTNDPGSEFLAKVDALRQYVESFPFPGAGGESERSVVLAHLAIAARAGRPRYAASVRELGEVAGIGKNTVMRAHQRLGDKWFTLKKPSRGERAATYVLNMAEVGPLPTRPPSSSGSTGPEVPPLSHDVWRFGGLNKTGRSAYMAIVDGLSQPPEIAARIGKSKKTVKNYFDRLSDAGLIEVVDDCAIVVDGVDFDALAQELGVAGKGEKQKLRHDHERASRRSLNKIVEEHENRVHERLKAWTAAEKRRGKK